MFRIILVLVLTIMTPVKGVCVMDYLDANCTNPSLATGCAASGECFTIPGETVGEPPFYLRITCSSNMASSAGVFSVYTNSICTEGEESITFEGNACFGSTIIDCGASSLNETTTTPTPCTSASHHVTSTIWVYGTIVGLFSYILLS